MQILIVFLIGVKAKWWTVKKEIVSFCYFACNLIYEMYVEAEHDVERYKWCFVYCFKRDVPEG